MTIIYYITEQEGLCECGCIEFNRKIGIRAIARKTITSRAIPRKQFIAGQFPAETIPPQDKLSPRQFLTKIIPRQYNIPRQENSSLSQWKKYLLYVSKLV